MKAFTFSRTGEPNEVLSLEQVQHVTIGVDDVLVRMHLSPINTGDLHMLRGRFGRQPTLPATAGLEGMGTVESFGSNVTSMPLGARVVLLDVRGTWGSHVVAQADRVVLVPDGVTDEDAARSMLNPVTAMAMTLNTLALKPGDTLLQTAAGSTVGQLVLQIAKSEKFRTINLVRRTEQVAKIRELGGDVVICTSDDDWQQQVMDATDGKGVSHAIDCVAGAVGAGVARCLAAGGRLLVYGALSSHKQKASAAFEMPLFAPQLIYKATTIQGWYLFHWLESLSIPEMRKALETVLDRLAAGTLRLPPVTRYPATAMIEALAIADAGGELPKPMLDFSFIEV